MLDYRRKFIEAAQRYNELSYKTVVADEERMEALKKALSCTILASAGNTIITAVLCDTVCYICVPVGKGVVNHYCWEWGAG